MTLEELVNQYAQSLYHFMGGDSQTPEEHAENLEFIIDLFHEKYPDATEWEES